MNAEEELNKNLYGVHLELLDKHWAFKKCVLEAMEAYAKAYINEKLEKEVLMCNCENPQPRGTVVGIPETCGHCWKYINPETEREILKQ